MENPNSRPEAANLIDDVIQEHRIQAQGDALRGEFRAGWSLAMKIWDALNRAGYLKKEEDCPCPYDCDGCHDGDGVCERGNPEL